MHTYHHTQSIYNSKLYSGGVISCMVQCIYIIGIAQPNQYNGIKIFNCFIHHCFVTELCTCFRYIQHIFIHCSKVFISLFLCYCFTFAACLALQFYLLFACICYYVHIVLAFCLCLYSYCVYIYILFVFTMCLWLCCILHMGMDITLVPNLGEKLLSHIKVDGQHY